MAGKYNKQWLKQVRGLCVLCNEREEGAGLSLEWWL